MAGSTVRIKENTHKLLKQMAKQTGRPMQIVLDDAVEEYRRARFLDEMNQAYALLKANTKAWNENEKERIVWESASADNQDDGR